jgi:hypothetical protein
MADKIELTEHDIGLVKQALAIAVIAIGQALPQFQPESNHHEMDELLSRLVESDDELILYLDKARELLRHDDAE